MGLKTVAGVALAAALLIGGPAAAAKADKADKGTDASARRVPGKLSFHKAPSEESPAARERRLKRECQGRPNAGACLGFTGR